MVRFFFLIFLVEITALRAKIAEMRESLMNQVKLYRVVSYCFYSCEPAGKKKLISLRSKRFRASSSRMLGREQKLRNTLIGKISNVYAGVWH